MSTKETKTSSEQEDSARSLLFLLAGEQYGLDLAWVEEVFDLADGLVPVLGAPFWMGGVVNHHGQVLPVLDAARLLGLNLKERAQQALLLTVSGQRMALAVEQVTGVEVVSGSSRGPRGTLRAWHRGRILTLLRPEAIEKAIESRLTQRRPA
ncbi:MAG: chemotaxis protein CheW [Deltaproteobacteria bacterium]|nr:chemotaxis protein CheW [Deltaproteobacteria bacterium]